MDPTAAVGLGLNLFSGINGLLGGSAARRREEERRRQIIGEAMRQASQDEFDTQYQGRKQLASLSGELSSGLQAQGAALGDANAAAGVWNPSTVASANSITQGNNNSAMAKAFTDLAQRMLALRSSNNRYMTDLQLGANSESLADARSQEAGGMQSMAGALQMLPNFMKGFSAPPKPVNVDPIQSAIQSQQQTRAALGGVTDAATTHFAPGQGGTGLMMPKAPGVPFFPTPQLAGRR